MKQCMSTNHTYEFNSLREKKRFVKKRLHYKNATYQHISDILVCQNIFVDCFDPMNAKSQGIL